MKKTIILLFLLIPIAKGYSQTYFPFPDTASTWYESFTDDYLGGTDYYYYILNGDTTINNTNFHNLCKYEYISDTVIIGAIREDSLKRIYYYDYAMQYEFFLYDFNKNVGDTIFYDPSLFSYPYDYNYEKLIITHVDSVPFCNDYRKIFYTNKPKEVWIEGIGSYRSLLSPITPYPTCLCTNLCYAFEQNDTICDLPPYNPGSINENVNEDNCQIIISSDFSEGRTTLNFENCYKEIIKIEIFNDIGMLIQTFYGYSLKSIVLSTSNIQTGIYFFKLYTIGAEIKSGKFLIR